MLTFPQLLPCVSVPEFLRFERTKGSEAYAEGASPTENIFFILFNIYLLPCKPIFLAGHIIKIDSAVLCSSILCNKKTGCPVSPQELLQL